MNHKINKFKKANTMLNTELYEVEQILKQTAERLPEPQKELPVSQVMTTRKRSIRSWMSFGRAAIIVLSLLLFGSGTAFAASPSFRQAVIRFFTGGTKEEIPLEQLSDPKQPSKSEQLSDNENSSYSAEENKEETETIEDTFSPVTVGDVTHLQHQRLDNHFTVSYLSSPNYLDIVYTSSGNLLFYTQDAENEKRTYYQFIDGMLQSLKPEILETEGSILLENLPGVMNYNGDTSYSSVILPEMIFNIDWQQYGDDILLLNSYNQRFDIGSSFGDSKNGTTIKGNYDGAFTARALQGETSWVEIFFQYDSQVTGYQYPFLFNLYTGEIQDPLSKVDLSAYACITELTISDDKTTATALAGDNHNTLKKITINLNNQKITEEPLLSAPVTDWHTSFATSDHTVFYTTGTEEHMNGYLYDTESGLTTELFVDAAWGYVWDYGFADTYVDLLGGGFAAFYKEPENEVYLLNLADGSMQLLEGIPASHNVSFFWNNECSMLSIAINTELGASRLAFYIPDSENAWYFDRTLPENVHEVSASWYGEYGYLIQAVSSDYDQYYLYLYEYTQ